MIPTTESRYPNKAIFVQGRGETEKKWEGAELLSFLKKQHDTALARPQQHVELAGDESGGQYGRHKHTAGRTVLRGGSVLVANNEPGFRTVDRK